jgi:hypothetical protein
MGRERRFLTDLEAITSIKSVKSSIMREKYGVIQEDAKACLFVHITAE